MHFFPYRSEETWRKFHSRNATRDCSVLKEPKGNDIPFNSDFQRWPLPPLGSGCSFFFFMNLRSTSCWRKPCPQVRLQHARRWSILQTKTSGISKKPPGYASADSRCCVSKTAARKRWIDGVGCTNLNQKRCPIRTEVPWKNHTRLRCRQLTALGGKKHGNDAPSWIGQRRALLPANKPGKFRCIGLYATKQRTVCHLSLLFFFKKIPSKILEASAQYP